MAEERMRIRRSISKRTDGQQKKVVAEEGERQEKEQEQEQEHEQTSSAFHRGAPIAREP